MKQGDAVYQAIVNVCGEVEGAYSPDKEQLAQVREILWEGFKAGKIVLGKTYTDEQLRGYIPGLINNWIRKDKRLNGGVQYVAKNPGSRVGSSDPQVKALRALLTTKTDPTEVAEIEGYLTARLAELKSKSTKTVEINFDALPAELATKYATK